MLRHFCVCLFQVKVTIITATSHHQLTTVVDKTGWWTDLRIIVFNKQTSCKNLNIQGNRVTVTSWHRTSRIPKEHLYRVSKNSAVQLVRYGSDKILTFNVTGSRSKVTKLRNNPAKFKVLAPYRYWDLAKTSLAAVARWKRWKQYLHSHAWLWLKRQLFW